MLQTSIYRVDLFHPTRVFLQHVNGSAGHVHITNTREAGHILKRGDKRTDATERRTGSDLQGERCDGSRSGKPTCVTEWR